MDSGAYGKTNLLLPALLLLLFVWRIIFIQTSQLDLSPDEAYYWDWSRHLDWGYYSKPPMIAWIIGASTWLFGNTVLGIRLPAALLSTLSLIPLYLLSKRLFNEKVGLAAVLISISNPGACLPGFVMTIDAPLLFFWSLGLYTLWLALEEPQRPLWWIITGIVTGLGLLSKQTMAAFWALAAIYVLANRNRRALIKRPWPYLAIGIFLFSLLPVILWNEKHGWITLEHTAHHFEGLEKDGGFHLKTFLQFVGSQFGIISPVSFLLIFTVGTWSVLMFKKTENRTRFLACMSPLALLGVVLLSLKQKVNANWPAPFYLAGMCLTAAWAHGFVKTPDLISRLKRLFWPGVVLGAFMAITLYTTPYLWNQTEIGKKWPDPTYRLRGWKELGLEVNKVLQDLPRPSQTFIMARKRQTVSELAFYLPGQPTVYRWAGLEGAVHSQYELWPGPEDKIGWDCLMIIKANQAFPQDLARFFEETSFLSSIEIPISTTRKRAYKVYLFKGLKSWPSKVSGPTAES